MYDYIESMTAYAAEHLYRQRKLVIAIISVMMIVALTTGGFGGQGNHSLTALAETSSDQTLIVSDDQALVVSEKEMNHIDDNRNEIKEEELSRAAESGRQVVGYLLKQDMQRKADLKTGSRTNENEDRYPKTDSRANENEEGYPEAGERGAELTGSGAVKGAVLAERIGEEKIKEEKNQEFAGRGNQESDKPVSVSDDDYQVLLQIVEAEAGVCDEKGKILVANVILNRVRNEEFPDTITRVVYQPSQFSPVSNGTINTCKVTSETVACVRRALEGEDYSQGALYFMNRKASGSGNVRWFDGRLTFLFRHGGHEFFK